MPTFPATVKASLAPDIYPAKVAYPRALPAPFTIDAAPLSFVTALYFDAQEFEVNGSISAAETSKATADCNTFDAFVSSPVHNLGIFVTQAPTVMAASPIPSKTLKNPSPSFPVSKDTVPPIFWTAVPLSYSSISITFCSICFITKSTPSLALSTT